jgi:hypothetical protein
MSEMKTTILDCGCEEIIIGTYLQNNKSRDCNIENHTNVIIGNTEWKLNLRKSKPEGE